MKQFDADQCNRALAFRTLIPALREAFDKGASVPLRHTHTIESQGVQGTTLIMPAWNEAGFFGVKTINIFPANGAQGLPGLHATYVLYSATTGVPLALIDGDAITARRTAGAAALGADFLARKDARRLLVLGAGRIAALVPGAMRAVRDIEHVDIWNPRPVRAAVLAETLRKQGIPATPLEGGLDALEAAARQADLISCATLAEAPLIQRDWLQPGTHLDLIGSFKPSMTEAAPECFLDTEVYVDTDEAALKSGDLLNAFATGRFATSDIRATLEQLCRGQRPGRTDDQAITVFKAVGSALEDLTAAVQVYQKG